MIDYSIVHHVPGRIRIGVPLIKELSVSDLRKRFSAIEIPEGIRDIRPNPITGTVVISYDPGMINILEYLENVAAGRDFQCADVKGGCDE